MERFFGTLSCDMVIIEGTSDVYKVDSKAPLAPTKTHTSAPSTSAAAGAEDIDEDESIDIVSALEQVLEEAGFLLYFGCIYFGCLFSCLSKLSNTIRLSRRAPIQQRGVRWRRRRGVAECEGA